MIQDLLRRLLRTGLGRVRDKRVLLVIVLVLAAILRFIPSDDDGGRGGPIPDRIAGQPRLADGDSFKMSGHEVRLVGIDAPEGRQMCRLGGRDWSCGTEAMKQLSRQVRGGSFSCKPEERDQYDRLLATCYVDGRNINKWMVENGWAVSYGRRYLAEERAAKREKRGIWKSEFQRPRDWRDANNRR